MFFFFFFNFSFYQINLLHCHDIHSNSYVLILKLYAIAYEKNPLFFQTVPFTPRETLSFVSAQEESD
jgi:hypothetical protein